MMNKKYIKIIMSSFAVFTLVLLPVIIKLVEFPQIWRFYGMIFFNVGLFLIFFVILFFRERFLILDSGKIRKIWSEKRVFLLELFIRIIFVVFSVYIIVINSSSYNSGIDYFSNYEQPNYIEGFVKDSRSGFMGTDFFRTTVYLQDYEELFSIYFKGRPIEGIEYKFEIIPNSNIIVDYERL